MDNEKWTCQLCQEQRDSRGQMLNHLKTKHEIKYIRYPGTTEIRHQGRQLATTRHQEVMIY